MDNSVASGGAKPKTSSGINNNNSSNQAGGTSTGTLTVGPQSRNRSPRRENTYASRSTGRGLRNIRGTPGNGATSHGPRSTPEDSASRRASVPSSTGRTRHSSSTQTRSSIPQRFNLNDYSPLRGVGRPDSRSLYRQNGSADWRRPTLRPMPPRSMECMPVGPLESPNGDVLPPISASIRLPISPPLRTPTSPSLHGILSSSEDSDSDSGSPMSRPETPLYPCPAALPQANGERPVRMSRDAVLARELLQAEMDMMLQRDEEMARQLQSEIDDDHDEEEPSPLARPLSMFMPGGLQTRGRHFPTIPRRQDGGYAGASRGQRSPSSSLRFLHSPSDRSPPEPTGVGRAMRLLMGVDPPRGISSPVSRSASESDSDSLRRHLVPRPLDMADFGVPSDEYDPDERLLARGFEPPDDFLSMMNDPSLMLLMLLLRAPDSMHHNEAGVDLDDYEALWELAEQLGEVRRRGISEEQINSLPTHKYKSQEEDSLEASAAVSNSIQCQICLVDFENGDCLRCIPCKHDFHKDCIDEWLKRNATCPICRQDIKPNDK